MHYIVCEGQYAQSVWCQKIVGSLENELKKRRIPFQRKSAPDSFHAGDTVFLVGADHVWLQAAIAGCNRKNIAPILLCNDPRFTAAGRCHCICADISAAMRRMLSGLQADGICPIALYGINPHSASDQIRAETFTAALPEGRIFYNNGSLGDCFLDFLPLAEGFGAVLCANSFAAISLVRRLQDASPEALQKLRIISCTEARLTGFYEQILSMELNYEQFGPAALSVADISKKQPYISSITVKLGSKLPADPAPAPEALPASTDRFYRDGELMEMMTVERLLENCDDTDRKILALLTRELSTATIADRCYFTESSIKYRIRKMTELCNVADRKALIRLLKNFL